MLKDVVDKLIEAIIKADYIALITDVLQYLLHHLESLIVTYLLQNTKKIREYVMTRISVDRDNPYIDVTIKSWLSYKIIPIGNLILWHLIVTLNYLGFSHFLGPK